MRTTFQKFKASYFLYSFKRDKVAIFSFCCPDDIPVVGRNRTVGGPHGPL
jgi:hypothetical protein